VRRVTRRFPVRSNATGAGVAVSLLATLALLFAFVAEAGAETIAGADVEVAGSASESAPVVPAEEEALPEEAEVEETEVEEASPAEVEPAEVATSAGDTVASTQTEIDPAGTPDPPAVGNATAAVAPPVDSTAPTVRQAVKSSSAQITDSGERPVATMRKSTTGDVETIAKGAGGALPDLVGLDAVSEALSLLPKQLLPQLAQTPSDRPALDGAPPQLGGPFGIQRVIASAKAPVAYPDLTRPGGIDSAWLGAPADLSIDSRGSRAPAIGRTGDASFDSAIDRPGSASRPNELPPPGPRAPAAVSPTPDGPTFVPIAGLLALLALAAPAAFSRRRKVPGSRASTLFVCVLERPG